VILCLTKESQRSPESHFARRTFYFDGDFAWKYDGDFAWKRYYYYFGGRFA